MKLWKLERESPAYEEFDELLIVGETEEEARIWAVRWGRNTSYAAEWLIPEESTCVVVGEALSDATAGQVLMTSKSPS